MSKGRAIVAIVIALAVGAVGGWFASEALSAGRLATADAKAAHLRGEIQRADADSARFARQVEVEHLQALRAAETARDRLDETRSQLARLAGHLDAVRDAQQADRWATFARGAMDVVGRVIAGAGSAQGQTGPTTRPVESRCQKRTRSPLPQ